MRQVFLRAVCYQNVRIYAITSNREFGIVVYEVGQPGPQISQIVLLALYELKSLRLNKINFTPVQSLSPLVQVRDFSHLKFNDQYINRWIFF